MLQRKVVVDPLVAIAQRRMYLEDLDRRREDNLYDHTKHPLKSPRPQSSGVPSMLPMQRALSSQGTPEEPPKRKRGRPKKGEVVIRQVKKVAKRPSVKRFPPSALVPVIQRRAGRPQERPYALLDPILESAGPVTVAVKQERVELCDNISLMKLILQAQEQYKL